MDYQNITSACVFCGGVVIAVRSQDQTESTCMHCGYELYSNGNRFKSMPERATHGGYGKYHVHYKDGYMTFGCFPSPITGNDVEGFLRFIEEDPSVDEKACILIRNNEGTLQAILGQMPPLYDERLVVSSRLAGVQYA